MDRRLGSRLQPRPHDNVRLIMFFVGLCATCFLDPISSASTNVESVETIIPLDAVKLSKSQGDSVFAALEICVTSHNTIQTESLRLRSEKEALLAEINALKGQIVHLNLVTKFRSLQEQLDVLQEENTEADRVAATTSTKTTTSTSTSTSASSTTSTSATPQSSTVQVQIYANCSNLEVQTGRRCVGGGRHASYDEVVQCTTELCAHSTVAKWAIVNGDGVSILGAGYSKATTKRSCEVIANTNDNGGESICMKPPSTQQLQQQQQQQQQQPQHDQQHQPEVPREEMDLGADCNTLVVEASNVCTHGRPVTTLELIRCRRHLCTVIGPWSIINGLTGAIIGKRYGCKVEQARNQNSGESICVPGAQVAPSPPNQSPAESNRNPQLREEAQRINSINNNNNNNNHNNNNNNNNKNIRNMETETTINSADWSESGLREKQTFVRNMFKQAWSGYKAHAWGDNELNPQAKRGIAGGLFGAKMGSTIIDSLDTLHIMGLTEEFEEAREWVKQHLNTDINASVSVFETVIRFLGGLLSAFALTHDPLYRDKAVALADKLLPAFNTKSGIPHAAINLVTGASRNWGWAPGRAAILSEFGTIQLEFEYLSDITNDNKYRNLANNVTELIFKALPDDAGLVPNFINTDTGKWSSKETSMGPYGDSFYEYLLKVWVYRGGRNGNNPDSVLRQRFDRTMTAVRTQLHHRSPDANNLLYVADYSKNKVAHQMWHLTCFLGGLYALSARTTSNEMIRLDDAADAADVTHTCHHLYDSQPTKLGAERTKFSGSQMLADDARYLLRPETIESYFYLWRTTHDVKYRLWAWEAAQAIEKNCRCGVGYCGIKDVKNNNSQKNSVQESFFLAETLKYLYLTFSDDTLINIDEWVFNTEAHPVPIRK